MKPVRPQPPPHRQRIAVWWIAFALLLAPLLGRMHQVVHGGGAVSMAAASHIDRLADASAAAPQARAAGQGGEVLHALFSGHHGTDCQLLDQLLLGGALLGALVLPTVHGTAQAPLPQRASHAGTRQRSAFLARAPPAQG